MNRFLLICICTMFSTMNAVAAPAAKKGQAAKPARPRTSFTASPGAIALLDQSIAAYKKLKGLSLRYETIVITGIPKGLTRTGTLDFEREGELFKARLADDRRLIISDGKWFYMAARVEEKNKPQKWKRQMLHRTWPEQVQMWVAPGYGSDLFGSILQGLNPLREKISQGYPTVQTVGKRLPDTIIEGVELQGVQIRIRAWTDYNDGGDGAQAQWTAWFDPSDHLLRRVQFAANDEVTLDRFLDVKTNPDFAADFFKIPVALPAEKTPKQ